MPKLNKEKWATNRDDIVAEAFKLFALKGYSRVSVNEIIKEAGISKGCFYTYFNSKQEVFFAIVENSDMSKATLSTKIDCCLSPEERIAEYIGIRLRNFLDENHVQWVKFASEFWATVEFTEEMSLLNQKRYLSFAKDIKQIINAGIELGHFRKSLNVEGFIYHPWQEDSHLLAFLAHLVRAKVGDELPAPQMRRLFEQITSYIAEKVVQ